MTLRHLARDLLPAPIALAAMRATFRLRQSRPESLAHLVLRLGNPAAVLQGPFRGLHGLQQIASPLLAMLAGTYEKDLHPAVESLIAVSPDVVINIGCGEGYYAVGLALRLPRARLVGFDLDRLCRAATRRVARKNGVAGQVRVEGHCRVADLGRELAAAQRPAVVCDCEGGERELLDPAALPALARTWILVEVHDMYVAGISREIARRFAPSHRVTRIDQTPRVAADLPPGLPALAPGEVGRILDDQRVGNGAWLWLEPRAG
jgi:hypothetical protein